MKKLIELAEHARLPDWAIRIGMRHLLRERLRQQEATDVVAQRRQVARFVSQLRASPLAFSTEAANQQHYEVPAEFFKIVLGPR